MFRKYINYLKYRISMGFCFIFCDKCFHRERLSIIHTVDKMTRECYYSWEIFFDESTAEELELMILVINVLQDWLPCVMFEEYGTFLYVFGSFYYATGLILFFFLSFTGWILIPIYFKLYFYIFHCLML